MIRSGSRFVKSSWFFVVVLLLFGATFTRRSRFSFVGFLFLVCLFLPFFLEGFDQILAVKVFAGFPCIVFVSMAFPLQEVLHFAVATHALVDDFFDGVLFLLLFVGNWRSVSFPLQEVLHFAV